METNELLKIIENDESQQIEFKARYARDVGESVCSFANTNDGTIFVGISDDHRMRPEDRIMGVSAKTEEKIAISSHSCKPSIYPRIHKEVHNGKIVFIVDVPYSQGIIHSFGNIAYMRVGRNDNPLSADEVVALAKKRRIVRFDDQLCGANISDIDEETIRRFVRTANETRRLDIAPNLPVEEVLEKLDLKLEDGLTNAAVLLFGRNPQRYVPSSELRCARFKGDELTFADLKVLRGNILEQIEDAEKFVMNNTALEAEVTIKFTREERWEYPLSAIREAVINAVCHRDYFSTANVQISIFDDKIEIWNPGELPPELTIADLRGVHKSFPRNRIIARILFLSKHIEQLGTGTQRMIQATLSYGLPELEFIQINNGFEVIFRKVEALLGGLNERQKQAWEYLRENEAITKSIYTDLCNCPPRTALSDIQDLVKKGILKREGIGKATVYRRIR